MSAVAEAIAVCHWGSIPGASRGTRSVVWICEYPYRTVKTNGPDRECEGCPVWEARKCGGQSTRWQISQS